MEKQAETRITVRFPAEVIEELRQLARWENRSLNGEIVQAVQAYLAASRKERRP